MTILLTQRLYWPCAILLALGVTGCGETPLRELLRDYTPHERYEQALLAAGLGQTALGHDWIAAADAALDEVIIVSPPYREASYLDPRQAMARAYRVPLRRGQIIEAVFESEPDSSYRVFIDLFATSQEPAGEPTYLASADSLERRLDYLARRDADFLVRIQPELLRGGRYSITIVLKPSLRFPVFGRDATAIGSRYGDSREGGRRHHEGLDIFAPRGTPVIAAAAGVVRSTRNNNLGGKVVWLRDDFGRTHYYAHLDSQAVRRGERLQAGDTLGYVGNTGNARTTPPHLHFGLYSRGSFDPYPALQQQATTPAPFTGDPALIGGLVRVSRDEARIRALPTSRSSIVAELPRHTPLRVEAGTGDWYRVLLPDGELGFVAAGLAEAADRPVRNELMASAGKLLTEPAATALTVDSIAAGAEVPVLGAFREFLYVQGPSGRAGWLQLSDSEQ
ncbi:MAG: peptidoglycan DD-metalloendopeptidase family protein [Gemmatimonadota bacterium]|nr:MAG: peptidoglycan DD-metalloendopeptidase family protein [Gemmatimonadota bacterium]